MLHRTTGLGALALLIGCMAIMIGCVPHPDLIVVMACYDVYRSLFANRNDRR